MLMLLVMLAQSLMLDCGWFGNPFHARGVKILFFGVVSGIGALSEEEEEDG